MAASSSSESRGCGRAARKGPGTTENTESAKGSGFRRGTACRALADHGRRPLLCTQRTTGLRPVAEWPFRELRAFRGSTPDPWQRHPCATWAGGRDARAPRPSPVGGRAQRKGVSGSPLANRKPPMPGGCPAWFARVYLSSPCTVWLMSRPSALPLSRGASTAMTLPMSPGPLAPTWAMTSAAAAAISSAVSCWGR
jgi:hypothetical protein